MAQIIEIIFFFAWMFLLSFPSFFRADRSKEIRKGASLNLKNSISDCSPTDERQPGAAAHEARPAVARGRRARRGRQQRAARREDLAAGEKMRQD